MECVVTLFRHFFLGGVCFAVCILNSAWRNEMRFLHIIRYLTNSKLVIAFLGVGLPTLACAATAHYSQCRGTRCRYYYIECVLLLDCITRQVIDSILFGTGKWWCRMSKRFLPPAEKRKTWVNSIHLCWLFLKNTNLEFGWILLLGWCAWRAASSPVALHLFHSCRVRLWKESTEKLIKKAVMECHYMEKYLWILTNFTLVRSADAVVKTESSRSWRSIEILWILCQLKKNKWLFIVNRKVIWTHWTSDAVGRVTNKKQSTYPLD